MARLTTARLLALARTLPVVILWGAGCEAIIDGQLGAVRCEVEGAVGPPVCQDTYACQAGLCVPSPPPVTSCTTDADCGAGAFCLDPALVGGTGANRCTRACCTSGDCDGQDVCWIPPDGTASVCWPAAAAGRAVLGAVPAWGACAIDGDCRSGRCSGGHCDDTCCSDTSCLAGNGACRFATFPAAEVTGFWCATAVADGGTAARYAQCKSDAECASGLCVAITVDISVCSVPCCSSEECGSITGVDDTPSQVRCVTLPGQGGARACAGLDGGTAATGITCAADSDCRSGMCRGPVGMMHCSDTCCSDTSCGDDVSLACLPVNFDDAWALQCEPK